MWILLCTGHKKSIQLNKTKYIILIKSEHTSSRHYFSNQEHDLMKNNFFFKTIVNCSWLEALGRLKLKYVTVPRYIFAFITTSLFKLLYYYHNHISFIRSTVLVTSITFLSNASTINIDRSNFVTWTSKQMKNFVQGVLMYIQWCVGL